MLIIDVMKVGLTSAQVGFTLPEMLLAVVIMAMGLSVFATALTMASRATYTARDEWIAMNYAREEVEKKHNLVYGDSSLNVGTTTISNSLYQGQLIVSYIGGSSTTKLKQVTATINWKNITQNNTTTNVRMTTVISSSMH